MSVTPNGGGLEEALRGYYDDHGITDDALRRVAAPRRAGRGTRRWLLVSAMAASLALLVVGARVIEGGPAPAAPRAPGAGPRLVAVQIHADWCARTEEVGPMFAELLRQYGNRPVLFVTLDITDDVRREQAKLLSETLGIPEAFAEPFGSGMIKLIDRDSHVVLAAVTGREQLVNLQSRMTEALRDEGNAPRESGGGGV